MSNTLIVAFSKHFRLSSGVGSVRRVVCSRLFGLADPRSYGSKNPGRPNAAQRQQGRCGNDAARRHGQGLAGGFSGADLRRRLRLCRWLDRARRVAVFFGHLYPVFLKFKGGKASRLPPGCCWRSTRGLVWRYCLLASGCGAAALFVAGCSCLRPRRRRSSLFSCGAATCACLPLLSSPWPDRQASGRTCNG